MPAAFLRADVKCVVVREGSVAMHRQSPPQKNSFLEDLEKLDVSV